MNRMIVGLVALLAWPAGALAQEGEVAPEPAPELRLRPLPLRPLAVPSLQLEAADGAEEQALEAEPAEREAFGAEALEAEPADELLLEEESDTEAFAEPADAESANEQLDSAAAQIADTQADTAIPAADPDAEPAAGPNYPAMVVNFLAWLAIVFFLLRRPLTEFLKSRRQAVVEGLEESKRIRQEAEAKHAEYTERLAHLDEELEKLRKEMIQAGEAERDRIIAEAEARAARMRRDAQFLIDQQMKQLKADLTREAIEAAVKAAEEVLSAQTSPSDQQRLAKAYLSDLGASMKKDKDQVQA